MDTGLSSEATAALRAIAANGCTRVGANSMHLAAYEELLQAGLADATSFDERARFYGLTELGQRVVTAITSKLIGISEA